MQISQVMTSSTLHILKEFVLELFDSFQWYVAQWYLICMIQQSYIYDISSLCPDLMLFELKITEILRSSGWGLEKE